MSPSWTERVRLAPRESAGVALGRDYVGFARLGPGGRSDAPEERPLATQLFCGPPTAQAQELLSQALRPLAGALGRRFVPLHVSLPDAAVRYGAFELEQLPKSRAARLDLARFRFGRQGTQPPPACACQPLTGEAGKPLLFGMAMDAGWRRLVVDALAQAGLRAWSMNPNGCRQFNRFHDRLTQTSGALVALAPDAWSLWLWDERGTPRYARARWRQSTNDYAGIAQEAERAILAYVHAGGVRTVARVFTAANGETGVMGEALDARLREPCTRLEAEHAALAAALER